MDRPKSLKILKWLVDYVAIRCLEREEITGFRVELIEGVGVSLGADMGDAYMSTAIGFRELELSNTDVVGTALDHLFADLVSYRKDKASP